MAETWSTPHGRDAAKILAWVNAEPAARAAEGLKRLGPLALGAPNTRSLHEVEDVTRVVARLVPP